VYMHAINGASNGRESTKLLKLVHYMLQAIATGKLYLRPKFYVHGMDNIPDNS
jgi:hypothetical protein